MCIKLSMNTLKNNTKTVKPTEKSKGKSSSKGTENELKNSEERVAELLGLLEERNKKIMDLESNEKRSRELLYF